MFEYKYLIILIIGVIIRKINFIIGIVVFLSSFREDFYDDNSVNPDNI